MDGVIDTSMSGGGYVSCQSYPTGHSSADAHVNAHVDITTGSLCRAACRRRFELERSGGAAEAAQQDEVGEAAQQDEAEEEGEGKNENDGGGDKIAESESSNYERDYESYKSYKSYDELYRGDHGLYMTYSWLSYSYVYDDLGGRADDDVVADDLGTGAEENDGLGTGAEGDGENDGSSGGSSGGSGSSSGGSSSSGGRLYHKDGLLLLTAECRCNVVSVDDYQHHQQQQQQQQQQRRYSRPISSRHHPRWSISTIRHRKPNRTRRPSYRPNLSPLISATTRPTIPYRISRGVEVGSMDATIPSMLSGDSRLST
mmetsp:Transcript_21086/g.43080  ORF Transcript_21086/g.43080 Transcript_21086/m.43080 type:complete len:314 (+) Transcript_21086:319-1260(+)